MIAGLNAQVILLRLGLHIILMAWLKAVSLLSKRVDLFYVCKFGQNVIGVAIDEYAG